MIGAEQAESPYPQLPRSRLTARHASGAGLGVLLVEALPFRWPLATTNLAWAWNYPMRRLT